MKESEKVTKMKKRQKIFRPKKLAKKLEIDAAHDHNIKRQRDTLKNVATLGTLATLEWLIKMLEDNGG